MHPRGETTREGRRTCSWLLRTLAWILIFGPVITWQRAEAQFPARPNTLPGPIGPEILSEPALLRPPQEFSGLPSVISDDPYAAPLLWPVDPPLGYSGPSGIVPRETQQDSHFVPMEDRWRIGFPEWDRYGNGQ